MGIVSRIEDDDAERAERLRQDRKLQEQQLKTKQLSEDKQFQSYVAKAEESKKQNDAHDQQKNETNQNARQSLLARRGIDNNERTTRMFGDGAASNARNRERLVNDSKGQQKAGEDAPKPQAGGGDTRATRMGVRGGGSRQQDDAQSREEPKRPRNTGANAPLASAAFAAIGQAAVQALDGMGARTKASSAVEQADKVRKMIEEIVAGVRQGLEVGGKNAFMEITLNGDTLNGARLTVLSNDSGIHLKVDTNELGARRSDRPVESLLVSSATELSHALQAANVKLLGLEVNGEKVIA